VNEAERFKEGKANSHLANDSSTLLSPTLSCPHHPIMQVLFHADAKCFPEDERTIANKLAREEKREKEADLDDPETAASKKDSTLPAKNHGNEPSKGAKIDQELKEEEEAILKKKGAWGSKQQ
jgi:hypothetical protein